MNQQSTKLHNDNTIVTNVSLYHVIQ